MTLRAVFFDLDGTLLDTAPNLGKALNTLLEQNGKAPLPDEEIRQVVSDGAYALLEIGFGVKKEDEQTPALRQSLLDLYLEDLASATVSFPGLEALIEKLHQHDIHWGIVTNKPATYAVPLMEYFSYAREPICLICPEHVQNRKPDPEPLYLACKQAQCELESAIYVGDHIRDIQCGQNAQMTTIAANYGYISNSDSAHSWGADHVVESGHELWPIIQSYL